MSTNASTTAAATVTDSSTRSASSSSSPIFTNSSSSSSEPTSNSTSSSTTSTNSSTIAPPETPSQSPSTTPAPGSSPSSDAPASAPANSTTSPSPASTLGSSTPPTGTTTIIQFSTITTNADGSTTFITTQSTVVSIPPTAVSLNSTGSTHVGAIAGGVVGGIAGLALLIALSWWLARRRRSNEFDGDFDPASVGAVGRGRRQSLVPDGPNGAEVTPYTFPDTTRQQPQMGEHSYGDVPVALGLGAAAATSLSHSDGPRSESEYPHTESSYVPNPHGSQYVQNDVANPTQQHRSQTSVSSSVYSQPTMTSQPRSAKEREALAQRYGVSANPMYSGASASQRPLVLASPSDGDDQSSGVLVHQDGGRVHDPEPELVNSGEIPPTYDSIPANERQ